MNWANIGISRHLKLTSDTELVQLPCRPVSYAMLEPSKEEIDRLVASNILELVETSDWSTPIVIVKKFER